MRKVKKGMHYNYAMKKMLIGAGIFLFGLIKYLGYSWEQAIMVLGLLIFLKGLAIKMECC